MALGGSIPGRGPGSAVWERIAARGGPTVEIRLGAPPPVPAEPLAERFGRHRHAALIGQGGMGQVLEALDPDLNRQVAIMILRAGPLADARQIGRFLTEAQVTSQLRAESGG